MSSFQKFLSAGAALALLLGVAGCGGEDDVLLFLDFAESNAAGSSQVNAISVTTSDGAAGIVSVELEVRASAEFSGDVDFRANLDPNLFDITGMSDPASGVFFSESNPDATSSEGPFPLSAGESMSFFAVIDLANGSGDCELTSVRIATVPDSDFVEVHLRPCPPDP